MRSQRQHAPNASRGALARTTTGVGLGARAAASSRVTEYGADPRRSTKRLSSARPLRPSERLLFSNETWRLLTRSLRLSRREFQIVLAMFDDQKESAMASDLGISPHTVHTHIDRLYRKLSVSSRVALVRRILVEYLYLARAPDEESGQVFSQERPRGASHLT
jgi:DNA-binding CsgD family transcriptional regulator